MASFNKVIIAGNLTRDPEMRYTPKGTAIASLSIAVNRRWTGEDGQQREEVTYVDVEAFGKQAETISQYLKKGGGLLVEGRLRLDQWEDKQTGQKRSKLGVVLEGFTFLGSPNQDDRPQQTRQQAPPPAAQRPAAPQATQPKSQGWRNQSNAPARSEWPAAPE